MIPGLKGQKGKDNLKKNDKRKRIKQYAKIFFCYFKKPFSTAQEFLLLMSDKRQLFIIWGWLFTTNRVKTCYQYGVFSPSKLGQPSDISIAFCLQ